MWCTTGAKLNDPQDYLAKEFSLINKQATARIPKPGNTLDSD